MFGRIRTFLSSAIAARKLVILDGKRKLGNFSRSDFVGYPTDLLKE